MIDVVEEWSLVRDTGYGAENEVTCSVKGFANK
jgi:hypothetical protein